MHQPLGRHVLAGLVEHVGVGRDLVLLDGDPVYIDAEGTSLRRVANTPFFLVQETGNGTLYLKGGDIWYTAREITGPWVPTTDPPREAVDLAEKSQTDSQPGKKPGRKNPRGNPAGRRKSS